MMENVSGGYEWNFDRDEDDGVDIDIDNDDDCDISMDLDSFFKILEENKQGSSQIGTSESYGGGQPPSVGDMAKVVVSQTSDGVDPYNHPKGPSLSEVNQPRSSQIGTSESYGGGQPPSVGDMAKVVVSQTSDGVDPYNHPKGPSLSEVNQPRSSQIGTSETYGGGQPPSVGAMSNVVVSQTSHGVDPYNHQSDLYHQMESSVGAMAKVVVSQTSDGVDPYNHPKGTSLISDVNQRNSSQNGTSNQDIVMLDAPGAQELVGMSS